MVLSDPMPKKRNSKSSRQRKSTDRLQKYLRPRNRRVIFVEKVQLDIVSQPPKNSVSREVEVEKSTDCKAEKQVAPIGVSSPGATPEPDFVLELEGNEFDFTPDSTSFN